MRYSRQLLTIPAVIVGAVIVYVFAAGSAPYVQSLVVLIGIYYVFAASLNLVVGYTDLVSFGHAAYFAVGAYATALATIHWGTGLILGAVIGALLAATLAAIVALSSRQLSGVYFALATLAAAEIVRFIAMNWADFTRGPFGLSIPGSAKTLLPGVPLTSDSYLPIILILAALTLIGMWWLIRSDIGSRMISVRENPGLAASVGVSPFRYRLIAFVLAGAIAAVAGAVYSYNYGILTPDLSGLHYDSLALLMVMFGGRGRTLGPLVGAVVFVLLPQWIDVQGSLGELVFAAILFVVVLLVPGGVVGTIADFARTRRSRRAARRAGVERLEEAA